MGFADFIGMFVFIIKEMGFIYIVMHFSLFPILLFGIACGVKRGRGKLRKKKNMGCMKK